MKILMVNKFLYPRGGSESYMLKLGDCLKKQGHQVEYFGMYDDKNTVSNAQNITTQNMDFHSSAVSRYLYPFKIIYSFEAKKMIACQLIKRVEVRQGYILNIELNLTYQQFLEGWDAAESINAIA